jgi:hypothetical protein
MRMTRSNTLVAAALLALAGLAAAQAGPSASAPRSGGPGMMMRDGGCCGPGWRAGPRNTSGWALMTPDERRAHHEKMQGMKSHDECRATMDQHHAEMVARAKERGTAMPGRPRGDPCSGFKKS